jgi:hypothetical protein
MTLDIFNASKNEVVPNNNQQVVKMFVMHVVVNFK